MTPLRRRMLEDMQLRGFSARTQECYAAAVRQLAAHYHRSPDQLTEEDLRQYFLYLALGRYIFRVAIANSALERIQDGQVTFRYRDNRTQHLRRVTLSGIEFLQRFLQHVLLRGCTK